MQAPLLQVWKDENNHHSAAENMALDEALFLSAVEANTVRARFYNWSAPAITLGYFHKGEQTADAVRRMTGGGMVEHGDDLTFSLAYPKDTDFARTSGTERYSWVHQALAHALESADFRTDLSADFGKASGPCFAAPVRWDILDPASREKIAGGAQRRSRGAVIHQGSIRIPAELRSPGVAWIDQFLTILAEKVTLLSGEEIDLLGKSARTLEFRKYGNSDWNSK